MFRKITLLLGLAGILFGCYHGYETFQFIMRSEHIDARVLGYSSFHKLDRIPGSCTAFSKACEVELAYETKAGERLTAQIPQPFFSHMKSDTLSILVDPLDPKSPKIAALHLLFRNGMVSFFLGVVILFVRWLIGQTPKNQ